MGQVDTKALFFCDVVDSTAVVQRLGDEDAASLWIEHDRLARGLVAEHNGREIDRSDGFFLMFDDAIDAARFALRYHAALMTLGMAARAGLHVGTVTIRENAAAAVARGAKQLEVEGLAKPLAARVMSLARGGQTLLSEAARWALSELPPETAVRALGHYRLKGLEEPQALFELGPLDGAFMPPKDSEKAYRVVRQADVWHPVREVRHNLAPERDAFIGRKAELRHLAQQLERGARLISVLGVGGTGKTRLVRRYGKAWLGEWPGGVYFCDLSDARSLEGICFAVALALEVPLGKGDPVAQLGHAIAGRGRCLLILDNFEQVAQHASSTLGQWLDRAAETAIIATTRERLQLAGEEVFAIEPLAVETESIELFVARARSQRPEFVLDDTTRESVAEAVKLLDGLPLAIELAAARIRVLSPAQIVQRLRDRFALLAGARGTAARQATLKAAVDWSWELLAPWERDTLAQCSAFQGGFTLQAAETVLDLRRWPDAPSALDAVQSLVDKSLLRTWVLPEGARLGINEPYFGMYLTIHEYAAARLDAEPGATRAARERHGRYFAGFGTVAAIDALFQTGGAERRRKLVLELDNLVAACRHAVARGDAPTAVPTYVAAWTVLETQGPLGLGAQLGDAVLAVALPTPALYVRALISRATAAWRSGRFDDSSALLGQALPLAVAANDRRCEGMVRSHQGQVQLLLGRLEQARVLFETALTIFRQIGPRHREAWAVEAIGNVCSQMGRTEEAAAHYEDALAIGRDVGNSNGQGILLLNLGAQHANRGRFDDAQELYVQALALFRESSNRVAELLALNNLGVVEKSRGRFDEAQRYFTQALAVAGETGSRVYEGAVMANLADVRRSLGQIDQARTLLEAALVIDREQGNRREEGIALADIGELQLVQGRLDEAQTSAEQALAIHREVGNRRSEGRVLGTLGQVLAARGACEAARVALQEGETTLRDVDDAFELALLLCARGHVDLAVGEHPSARAALAEAETIATRLAARPGSALSDQVLRLRAALA